MLLRHATLTALMMMSMVTAASSSSPFFKSLRRLEDEESEESEEEEEEEEEEEVDYQFLSSYNVLYENCFQGDYTDGEDIKEPTITFQLCPSGNDCQSGCTGGGKYTANFYYFLDAYTELQLGAREYACEMVRESCAEDEGDDDAFWSDCYTNAGYSYCIDNDNEDFQLQQYLECQESELEDENGNALYIGPYCSNSIQIYIGIFSDEYCTEKVGDPNDYAYYEDYANMQYTENGGTSIIIKDDDTHECAKCVEHAKEEDQNEGDQEDEDDTLEQCEELYENVGYKCESDMEDMTNADSSGCSAIEYMEVNESGFQERSNETELDASRAFVVGVGFVVAFILVGYYLIPKNQNKKGSKSAGLIPNKNDLH